MSALLGKNADKLESVEKPHAMADHGAQILEFSHFRDGKLQRHHFSGTEFAGHDRTQPILGDFEAAAVNA